MDGIDKVRQTLRTSRSARQDLEAWQKTDPAAVAREPLLGMNIVGRTGGALRALAAVPAGILSRPVRALRLAWEAVEEAMVASGFVNLDTQVRAIPPALLERVKTAEEALDAEIEAACERVGGAENAAASEVEVESPSPSPAEVAALKPPRRKSKRKRGENSEAAIAILQSLLDTRQDPTDAEVAKLAGVDRSLLCRDPYKTKAAELRGEARRRGIAGKFRAKDHLNELL